MVSILAAFFIAPTTTQKVLLNNIRNIRSSGDSGAVASAAWCGRGWSRRGDHYLPTWLEKRRVIWYHPPPVALDHWSGWALACKPIRHRAVGLDWTHPYCTVFRWLTPDFCCCCSTCILNWQALGLKSGFPHTPLNLFSARLYKSNSPVKSYQVKNNIFLFH